jgi:ketosteroid isomerase-like protein
MEAKMTANPTAEVIRQFNQAFRDHRPDLLDGLVADDCVMESIQPAPEGTRFEGGPACLAFWQALAADSASWFDVEDTVAMGDHAVILWRFNFGQGQSLRGVNVMRLRDGRIVEALGYSKTPGAPAPLPQ